MKSDLGYSIVEFLIIEIGFCLGGFEVEKWVRDWGVVVGEWLGFDKVSIEEFIMLFWDRGYLYILFMVFYV